MDGIEQIWGKESVWLINMTDMLDCNITCMNIFVFSKLAVQCVYVHAYTSF